MPLPLGHGSPTQGQMRALILACVTPTPTHAATPVRTSLHLILWLAVPLLWPNLSMLPDSSSNRHLQSSTQNSALHTRCRLHASGG